MYSVRRGTSFLACWLHRNSDDIHTVFDFFLFFSRTCSTNFFRANFFNQFFKIRPIEKLKWHHICKIKEWIMIIFNLSNLSTRSPSHNTQKITRLAGGLQFEMRVVRVWVWFCILILIIIWFFWHWELVIQMMTYWAKKMWSYIRTKRTIK